MKNLPYLSQHKKFKSSNSNHKNSSSLVSISVCINVCRFVNLVLNQLTRHRWPNRLQLDSWWPRSLKTKFSAPFFQLLIDRSVQDLAIGHLRLQPTSQPTSYYIIRYFSLLYSVLSIYNLVYWYTYIFFGLYLTSSGFINYCSYLVMESAFMKMVWKSQVKKILQMVSTNVWPNLAKNIAPVKNGSHHVP